MIEKKLVVIFGSSWPCGEWGCVAKGELEIFHPGINEYLKDYFDEVLNYSRQGSSLWQILYSIQNFLKYSVKDGNENIIVDVSDVSKNTLSEKYHVDYKDVMSKCTNFYDFYGQLNGIFFTKLQELAEMFDKTFYLIGSSNDIVMDTSRYHNLKIICHSWIEKIAEKYTPDMIPLVINPDVLKLAKNCNRLDICEEIYKESESKFMIFQDIMENKYFHNANAISDYHPNRYGHKVLSKIIIDFFTENEKTSNSR